MPTEEENKLDEQNKKVDGREGSSMEPTSGSKQTSKENRHLHIQDIATLRPAMSSPPTGTPFSSLHGLPFEYPYPSPNSIVTPPYSYFTSLPMAGSFPFPVTSTPAQRSHPYAFNTSQVNSTALRFPIWGRNVGSTNTKFAPTTAPPPVPPGLQKPDVKHASSTEGIDNDSASQTVVAHGQNLPDAGAQGGEAPEDQK